MMRAPLDRIGFGGYLSLAAKFPSFVRRAGEICEEFRGIYGSVKGKKPFNVLRVAVLNCWGKLRSWQCFMTAHELWYQQAYSYQGILEALSGLPVEVSFIDFDDVKAGALDAADAVINAGDGMNEHPTQALLDFYTMREKFGSFKGLKVSILGDIKHSRVAKSNLFGLTKLGAEVTMFAPATLMPQGIERMGAKIAKSREEALAGANVVMGLRIQLERMHGGLFPSLSEYAKYYGVSEEHLKYADKDCIVMHPGPVNRGVEFTSDVIDAENSEINEQVLNGVAVRMALLFLLCKNRQGGSENA